MITKKFSMLISSAVENGASQKNVFGNKFNVVLNSALAFPPCYNLRCELINASIWNSASNVSPLFDNANLRLILGGVPLLLQIPAGLYSLSALNSFISNELVLNGYNDPNRILLDPNYATSQVGIYFTVAGDQVDFTYPNSINTLLGFSASIFTCTVANTYIFSDSGKAQLNRVNQFLIGLSFISQGIPLNSIATNIISAIDITAPPNSLITYAPQQPIAVSLPNLVGNSFNNFSVALLDQQLRDVDTNGENFQFLLQFSYEIKV